MWKGKLVKNNEIALIAKTTANKRRKLEQVARKFLSYEVPCILWIGGTANRDYEKWSQSILQ